jgi:TolB-like protein/tetratricopeptide (TPR) repeat protein
MADVFVSYKREDATKVRKLVGALRSVGLDVWWDEDIPASAPWEATIEKALKEARAVIVCWSPESVASENVRSEARVARADGRLIQVFLAPCEPPLFFGERQGVDLSKWRGNADDPRIASLAETARKLAAGERMEDAAPLPRARSRDMRIVAASALLFLLALAGAAWWLINPGRPSGPQTLAVLPFRALNSADASLVDAIWDDTRGAIGRNPNLRVLGRQAVETLTRQDLTPADYRRKVGADYLLDGSVEHVGDQVQMKLSLVQTKDGAEIWSDRVGGKLDDVFAFQQRIAGEVEGRIRGRIAPGGGVMPQNIVTTGEVYALYAEARALVKKRDPDSERQAIVVLKKALAIDSNYAPAWAELAVANQFTPHPANDPQDYSRDSIAYAKRSLQLAPNLAYAHAVLAMVERMPPESEPDLRKAVALDPGNAEAWNWLGGLLMSQNRVREALAAYTRAVEIEPFWRPVVGSKMSALMLLGDWQGAAAEFQRVSRLGDPLLAQQLRVNIANMQGRHGDALRMLLRIRLQHPEISAWVDQRTPALLQMLGFIAEAQRLYGNGAVQIADYEGIPEPASSLWSGWKSPADFWKNDDGPALFARLLPKHGRLQEYMDHYRKAFPTADDFLAARSFAPDTLSAVAPTIAVVLREGGENEQASEILSRTEPYLTKQLQNGPATRDLLANLAFYRAAEGRNDEAISLLDRAVSAGWLPDNQYFASDIADEPCFAPLLRRTDFQAVRSRILDRIAEERAKVPLDLLARAYPPPRSSKLAA